MGSKTASPQSCLTVTGEAGIENSLAGDIGPSRRCLIVIVHGLATATGQDDEEVDDEGDGDAGIVTEPEWPWQWHGGVSPATRVADFLSLHNTSSQTLEFCYRLDPTLPAGAADSTPTDTGHSSTETTLGLSAAIVRGLAIELLDALRPLVDNNGKNDEEEGGGDGEDEKPELIFVGRDFGGLAVSLARWLPIYYPIAAATTVLVFYETPRPVNPDAGSWESLANWLLFVSGRSQHFSTDWIRTTARMIEVVCRHFVRSEQLHHTIHVECDNLSPVPRSAQKPRAWDGRDRVDDVERISAAAHAQTPLGTGFVEFLQALAREFHAPRRNRPLSDWKARSSANASDLSDVLNNLPGLETWSTTAAFCGCFSVPPGDDAYPLFSKLQTSLPETKTGIPATVIQYVFDLYSSNTNSAESLLASLCYQILCSKPYLYGRLKTLFVEAGFLDGYRTTWALFRMFQALVSCPGAGQTVCVLWEMPGTEIPREILSQLVGLTRLLSVSLKLAVLCSRPIVALAELPFPETSRYRLPHKEPNFNAILESELTALLVRRPALAPVRATLKRGLLAQRASDRGGLFVGPWNTVKIAVRAWLSLITRRAVPVSGASLVRALDSMPDTLDSLHANILQQTPAPARPLMRSILSWLVLAQRPLQVAELTTALAVENGIHTIDALRENSLTNIQDDMLLFLGSSVRIDTGGYLLLQPELAAFLKKQQQQAHGDASAVLPPNPHLQLAKTCLASLRLYKKSDIVSLAQSIESHPFVAYATLNWAFHYSQGKQERASHAGSIPEPFLSFFDDTELIVFWTRMHTLLRQPENPEKATLSQETVVAAVGVGCLDLVDCLLKQRPPRELETEPQIKALTLGLVAAIQKGNSTAMKRLLDDGITTPDALHTAALFRHRDLVRHFAPTAENLRRQEGTTGLLPLHLAAQCGALDIVEDLIRAGADVRAGGGPFGESPLHVASMHGYTDVIRRLAREIEKDGDDGAPLLNTFKMTPLHVACVFQQPESVRTLLHVWTVRDSTLYDVTSTGSNVLHICAANGRADIVDILLKDDDTHTVDLASLLDCQDSHGATPLHIAAYRGHNEVVKALLARDVHGSLPTASDESEDLPIHLASMNGHADVVKLLLTTTSASKQLSEEGHGNEQWCPIHLATRFGHVEVVRLLARAYKEHGVSLDLFDTKQRSALHFAAGRGHIESVRLLVENGATVDIVNEDNITPLFIACFCFYDVASYLVEECKASISLGNDEGITPLLNAAWGGNVRIMRMLIRNGAKWGDKDDKGRGAVHYSIASRSKDAVAYVLQNLSTTEADSAVQYTRTRRTVERIIRRSSTLRPETVEPRRVLRLESEEAVRERREIEVARRTGIGEARRELIAPAIQVIRGHAAVLLTKDTEGRAAIEGAAAGDLMIPLLEAVGDQHGNLDEHLQRMLLYAAESGHLANVTYLVKQRHVSPDVKDPAERTPLSLAASEGHLDVVKFLAPISETEQDSEGRTPLFYAAIMGHMKVVAYIMSIADYPSNDISHADNNGMTPLYIAVSDQKLNVVKLLLDNGANPNIAEAESNMTPLHIAAFNDDTGDYVRCLAAAKGVDGHVRDKYDRTPMFVAAYYGKEMAVEALIDCNWPANFAHGDNEDFPLHAAYDNERIIKLLVDRGNADVNQANSLGKTPLHNALDLYAVNATLLLQLGADPSLQDKEGNTSFHLAAKRQPVQFMKDLIDITPSSLGVKNKQGYNVFLAAVADGNTAMVEYFLGLDGKPFDPVGDRDNAGLTAIEIAIGGNEDRTLQALLHATEPINDMALMQRALNLCLCQAARFGAMFGEYSVETAKLIVQKLASESSEEDPFAYVDEKTLFDAIMAQDVAASLEHFPESLRDAITTMRDKHGWTWALFSAAFSVEDAPDESAEPDDALAESAPVVSAKPDEATLRPTTWTTEAANAILRPVKETDIVRSANPDGSSDAADAKLDADPNATNAPGTSQDATPDAKPDASPGATEANAVANPDANPGGLVLEWEEEDKRGRLAVLTDHPIPYGERFFFSVQPLETSEDLVGAGVGYGSCSLDQMPGWNSDTWGFHGDDGGIFHRYGTSLSILDDYKYGVGDTLGVFVDTTARSVFFSVNGRIVSTGFRAVSGRLFPMVGVGGRCKVILTLGSPPGTDPFKDEEGNEQMDKVEQWIA